MDLSRELRSRNTLWRAWAEIYSNAMRSGSPETRGEARAFASNAPRGIDRISRKLRQQNFIFRPQKGVLIKKSSGKKRPIVVAPIESRIVQRSILDTVQRIPPIKEKLTAGYNFGGIQGKNFGVPSAIQAVINAMSNRQYFIRTDVKSFFDSVKRENAVAEVLKYVDDEEFAAVFRSAVVTEIDDAARYGPEIKLFPLSDEGVAQGSCISPLLCNLLLADFDQMMNDRGIASIRYIDDILILGKDAKSVFAAFSAGQKLLASHNLCCYDPQKLEDRGKSEYGPVDRGFSFLGCEINGLQITPSGENRKILLRKVAQHFAYSLRLLRSPRSAFRAHATYAETIQLVSQTVQGWANTFGFCTNDRVMGSLDTEIDKLFRKYSASVKTRLKGMDRIDARRSMGLFSMADRTNPMSTQLLRSIAALQ